MGDSPPARSWRQALLVYGHPRVLAMLFLGFSAGLPFLLVFSTLSAWLTEAGLSRSAIGFFGWVGITYSIKVLWAPIIDHLRIPLFTAWLGKRRSWMLAGQLGIALGLVAMIHSDPQSQLFWVAVFAVVVAFSSATQDIAIDAYRIEAVITEYQGAMSAAYIFGYRVALLVAGAGALYVAEYASWTAAYHSMAVLMVIGMITVLLVAEPDHSQVDHGQVDALLARWFHLGTGMSLGERLQRWFVNAVLGPMVEFFQRHGYLALLLLLFVGVYRLSDITMGIMANPFYLDLGFSKADIASIGKVFGFAMTIAGSFIGGILVVRFGVMRPLLAGAVMVALTNLLFAHLAGVGADIRWLAVVISADNLSAGFSNAAFIAYLSGLTHRAYTATQYALFSSLMTLPGKFLSGFSGVVVDAFSYQNFFIYSACAGIPAIVLAFWLWRHDRRGGALAARQEGTA